MNEIENWLAANDRYIADALTWLRRRLERMSHDDVSVELVRAPHPDAATGARRRGILKRIFGRGPESDPLKDIPHRVTDALTLSGPESSGFPVAGDSGPQPALVMLAQRLGLSEFERHTLFLCAAMELDTSIGTLCAHAQRDDARPYPTFALALALFDRPSWDILSPERPLRYWRLIEVNQPAAQPLIHSALRADERIVNYLRGLNYLDDRLMPLMQSLPTDAVELPPSQDAVASAIARSLGRGAGSIVPAVQLMGSDSDSKLLVARSAAAQVGARVLRLAADAVPTAVNDQESFVRLWERETALMPVALYIDASRADDTDRALAAGIRRLMSRTRGVTFLDVRESWTDLGRPSLAFDVDRPVTAEQRKAWEQSLGVGNAELSAELAGQFQFNTPTIRSIAAASVDTDRLEAVRDKVWRECLRNARPALDRLAQPLEPKAKWDDIELPAAETALLRQIVEQVRRRAAVYDDWGFRERMNRGFGISALFAGESGTGKTMAAEVIANELGLLLYRIDLSAVVSKYIGETEKNLRRLFDAADEGGTILFFDEADALFGKRSEVKDSHDRYANIEINYLLQRMEAFRGLAILATNMKAALDGAFIRRLRFIVNFPFPGIAERRVIWEKAFPRETPRADLDYDRLARFNLSGGSVHSIALNAAFLAARAGTAVTMPLVLDSVRTEFRKLEKPINELDFRRLEVVEKRS